ncbi:MAG: addiction module protein [Bacteroidota bacterium]
MAAKKKKKMNALQLSIELSFDQLAAIVKKLSPGDREKLMIKMWQDDKPEKLTKQQKEFIDKRIKAAKDNPERMIPLDTFVKRLRQK